ncbi:MAG: hypothetical protein ACLGIN_13915 [Candidatus Sericytochromatia bacterium]
MATMTHSDATGEREFSVPFDAPPPGAPFQAPGEWIVKTAPPGDRPRAALFRFKPSAFEFQARLASLVAGSPLEAHAMDLGLAASRGQPVVSYAADEAVVAALPAGLSSLPALEAHLMDHPPAFDPAAYALEAIEFEIAPPRG